MDFVGKHHLARRTTQNDSLDHLSVRIKISSYLLQTGDISAEQVGVMSPIHGFHISFLPLHSPSLVIL